MKICFSPIAPMLALVGLEAAIVGALMVWVVLSWIGLAAVGPMPEIILGAIIAVGVIMALLPLARMAANTENALICDQNADSTA